MSNIYVQEPPTKGKVLLITTVGDVDVELWSKEAPKACRNFVQLCMEGYYNDTIFHRLVPDFIVQGGDPTGTGHGGDSIYGKPFQDEFHSRIRFVRRGLVAMANGGAHDNTSQFFFTLAATPELQNKNTIFGKVGGDTLYNMLKLGEGETDRNDRPLYPHKILKSKIISNPFDDIIPRTKRAKDDTADRESKKSDRKATKNFQLLSFGEEAEEDEKEEIEMAEALRSKGKSSHDLLEDRTLSSLPAVDDDVAEDDKSSHGGKHSRDSDSDQEERDYQGSNIDKTGGVAESVRKKLKPDRDKIPVSSRSKSNETAPAGESDDEDTFKTTSSKSAERLAKLKAEAKQLKKDLRNKKTEELAADSRDKNNELQGSKASEPSDNTEVSAFQADQQRYKESSRKLAKKGTEREQATLKMLAAFQARMENANKLAEYATAAAGESDDEDEKKQQDAEAVDSADEEDDPNDFSWTCHTLQFESSERKVLDANVHDADRYEIFDPRNPLTVRRREASARAMKEKR